MRAAFVYSFTGQAIAAVALAHALLLPLLIGGWISALAYGLAALGLSSVALAVVGRRMARSVAGLRAALGRFGASRDQATPFADTRSTGLDGLQHGLDKMYRRVARRERSGIRPDKYPLDRCAAAHGDGNLRSGSQWYGCAAHRCRRGPR